MFNFFSGLMLCFDTSFYERGVARQRLQFHPQ